MGFANVIVDLSAEAIDRTFTYEIPDGMSIVPGQRVQVPFGTRRLEGFVISLSDSCELPDDRIRPLVRVLDDHPVICEDLMALAEWMHIHYLCNLVDALRLMIPSQMRGGKVRERVARTAHLLLSEPQISDYIAANPRAKKQHEVIALLKDGDVQAAQLPAQALRALVQKGAVDIVEVEQMRTPTALRQQIYAEDPPLMPGQARALDELVAALDGGGRFLLHGVTGSGKTEIYIRLIRRALEMGKTAIVLVPEIALTPQMVSWFHARFGADAAVMHSALSAGERYDEWRRIRTGRARVVIGARSAVFAPLENIGVIVVDEEHESSYQSDRRPRYDAREVAWQRALRHGAVLVLGSATPSVSTYMRVMPGVRPENRLKLIELRQRVLGRPLPEVEIVDMRGEFERGNHSIFSARLSEALGRCLAKGQQAMLFINRRGYSTFVSCRACGYVVKCQNCDVSMTFHQTENLLRCHYCGSSVQPPTRCPQCNSRYIKYFGIGTQRVEEEVRRQFPQARVARMDNDTTQAKDAHQRILERFRAGETQILVGTQMIAKGLDFPNVTLVGVVAADTSLNLPDYRSTERTFQLITQVAGRAGRADVPGSVIVQTYEPDHYAIRLAAEQDYRAFYTRESAGRRSALYPPFTVIARIVYTAKQADDAKEAAQAAALKLEAALDKANAKADVIQLRADEAPLKLLRGESRWHVFLKVYFKADIDDIARTMQNIAQESPAGVRAELEINPTNML